MNERRDDTTEPDERNEPTAERERAPQNYYYDDGTGYEVYDPATDEENLDESSDNVA
ncbi:MAG: hypothetical protein ACR2G4_06405 [Pyrinomonadaceae bacterium]